MKKMTLDTIISGGQTGADQGGLEAAFALGLKTGGWVPNGYRTEEKDPALYLKIYGMQEHASPAYPPRTLANVRLADATVVFDRQIMLGKASAGCQLTIKYCAQSKRPCLINPPHPDILAYFLELYDVQVLNVAGNRESSSPGIQKKVKEFIIKAIQ